MLAVFFSVLICISGPFCDKHIGHEIVGKKGYFSKTSCEEDARLIAQAMWVDTKDKYGYRCVPVDYTPPKIEK